MSNYPVTVVSGFWKVKGKHSQYEEWFKNTLKIKCPYIFFGNKEAIETVKKYRLYPTHYVELNIKDFYTYKYKDKIITHEKHCPSVDVNLIWNEKIFLIERAIKLNKFNSEYFIWIDAGIARFRLSPPLPLVFPNINNINSIPKDKLIYSSSEDYDEKKVKIDNYYHHISATSMMLHKNIINKIINLYKKYLDKLLDKNNIWTEQVIWTHIYKDNKNLFLKACDGYGNLVHKLYNRKWR